MPENNLESLAGGELMTEISKTQNSLQDLCSQYESGIKNLDSIQTERIKIQGEENEAKNALKVTRSKIEQAKERLRSLKILIKAEANN